MIVVYDHQSCVEEVAALIDDWRRGQVLLGSSQQFRLSAQSDQISKDLAASLRNPSVEFESALDKQLSLGIQRLLRKIFRRARNFTISEGVLVLK